MRSSPTAERDVRRATELASGHRELRAISLLFYAVFAAYTGDRTFTRWPLLQAVGIRVAAESAPAKKERIGRKDRKKKM